MAGRYENPNPTRFIAHVDCSKITTQDQKKHRKKNSQGSRPYVLSRLTIFLRLVQSDARTEVGIAKLKGKVLELQYSTAFLDEKSYILGIYNAIKN